MPARFPTTPDGAPGIPLPPGAGPSTIDQARQLTANRRPWFRSADFWMHAAAAGAASTILLMLAALLLVLGLAARDAMATGGISFLWRTEWRSTALEIPKRDAQGKVIRNIVRDEDGLLVSNDPVIERIEAPVYGAGAVIYGTAMSSLIGLVIAVPLSMGAALFLVRVARPIVAGPVSFLIEALAAIPSIAYGMWGVFVLVPFLQNYFPISSGRNLLSAGLILSIMIVPIITSISRDVLKAVPRAQIEGTLALGATWWQSSWEMLRYSRSALFGAVILGLARAAGETMAVTLVIGNNMQIAGPLEASQTMASLLANKFTDASADEQSALMFVALVLLLMSLTFNIVARYFVVGSGSRTSAAH